MEVEDEHISTSPSEDQNNRPMQTDLEYGPASPPQGKEEIDDDEI